VDDAWSVFFKEHSFLVGLSVDGPRPLHDAYRVDKGGKGSFDQVMRGWACLSKHSVDTNILCTVHADNADHPLEVYRFLRDGLKTAFIQFIPIIERVTAETLPIANIGWGERGRDPRPLYTQEGDQVTERSVRPEQYGRFLSVIFDEWVRLDVGKVYVQMFDVTLGAHVAQYSLCVFAPTCGNALALEHNGDLYSCDHFVEPTYKLGNITEMATSAPGASSVRPNTCAPLAETLKLNGYSTAQFGKCHEVPAWETSPMGPFNAWPTGGGFEYFYGFLGGETNQYYPAIYEGTTPLEPPKAPEEGYGFTEDMTNKAINGCASKSR
jgi:uncharacterized protein